SSDLSHFNSIECTTLADSQLGNQCEVLLVKIENRTDVLSLLTSMNKLRSLTVQCKDDTWNNKDLSSTKDELVEWLCNCLP
ncbi:unnamed protein product, partial [Rotaria magnacalcarata]